MTSAAPAAAPPPTADRMPVGSLVVLGAAIFAAVTTEMMPVGLMPQLAASFRVDEAQIGWWMSAYAAVVATGAVPMAAAMRRAPRRRALVTLLLLYAVSNAGIILAGAVGSSGVALGARLVGGLAHAGLFTVVVSTAAALAPPGRQGRAVAAVNLGLTAALTLGVPLGTAVGSAWAWQGAFTATAVLLVALAVAAHRVLPPGTRDAPAAGSRPAAPGRTLDALVRVAIVTAVFATAHYTTYTYVAPVVLASGATASGVSLALFGHGLASLPGILLAGALADRHPVAALRGTLALTVACLAALALAPHSTVAVVASVTTWGLAFGAAPALLQTVSLRATGGSDLAPAVVNSMFNVGIASGAWVGGLVLGAGTPRLALTSATVATVALVLTVVLTPRLTAGTTTHAGTTTAPHRPAEPVVQGRRAGAG